MNSHLYLHYGPGGNSFVERELLGKQLPDVLFWDQPKVKSSATPYFDLVDAVVNKLNSFSINKVLAHSFGCDLLNSIAASKKINLQQAVLIGPMVSIPQAMFNLGTQLLNKKNSVDLESALSDFNLSPRRPETFWKMVGAIGTHPEYGNSFWKSQEQMQRYFQSAAQGEAFDLAEWQTLIQDYLFNSAQITEAIQLPQDTLVIFGEQDPYFNSVEDLKYWQNRVGKSNVIVLSNAGHFPHIEKADEFINIIKTRL